MNFDIAPQRPDSNRARVKPKSERRPKSQYSGVDTSSFPQSDRQEYAMHDVRQHNRPDTAHHAERVQYQEHIAVETDKRNKEARERQEYGAYYEYLPQIESNSVLLNQKTTSELLKLRGLENVDRQNQTLKDIRANLLNLRDEIEAQQAYVNQMPSGGRVLEVRDKNYALALSVENALHQIEEKTRQAEVRKNWSLDTHPVDTKPKVMTEDGAKWMRKAQEEAQQKAQAAKPKSTWGRFRDWWNGK